MVRPLVLAVVLLFAMPAFADEKPFPKPLKDGEKVKTDGWFGKKVLPKQDEKDIRMGDWKDGKQETWTTHNLLNCTVREERSGFLRVFDTCREGWVSKDAMVTVEDAPAYFDKIVKDKPGEWYGWHMRGVAWRKKGEYDNAIKDLTEAIRLKPGNGTDYSIRGNAWRDKNEYNKAIADFTEAIRLDPKDAITFSNRGNAWYDKKEYDKAIADYTEAIRLDPKNVYAFYGRGGVWCAKREYDKAISDCTDAIRLDPKCVYALHGRGSAWFGKKEYLKAVADYDAVLTLDSNEAYAHGNRGLTSAMLKKFDDTVAGFEKALELNPQLGFDRDYAKFRASCPEAKYRDGKKAVALAKKAIEKAGKDADWEYSDALAMAYAEASDFELAVAEQRKAIELLKAEKLPDKDDIKKAEERLELYRAKKPYRDE
jgi:tetratricopeptide (TPR) repeat protein